MFVRVCGDEKCGLESAIVIGASVSALLSRHARIATASCAKTWNVVDVSYGHDLTCASSVSGALPHRYHACGDDLRGDDVPKVATVETTVLPRYRFFSSSPGAYPCFYFCVVDSVTRVIAHFVCPGCCDRASLRCGRLALSMSSCVTPHHSG
jgi:hypothetical protein